MNYIAKKVVAWARKLDAIKTGYSQHAVLRWSVLNKKLRTLVPMKDCDCSTAFAITAWLAGIPWDLSTNTWTGNIAKKARDTGMYDVSYFNGDLRKVLPGGALLEPGHHIAVMLDKGQMLSPEQTEKHTTIGGKPGEQKSFEVRIRDVYKRRSGEKNGGWTYLINLTPPIKHLTRAIVAFSRGTRWSHHIDRMSIIAPHDGPLTEAFIYKWAKINKGLPLVFSPFITTGKIAIVVLGTKLREDGTLTLKFRERLALALSHLNLNSEAIIVISGGKVINGVSEAEAGKRWLLAKGVDPSRIFTEEKSGSTVGNAKYTVPLLMKLGVSQYVLVSHASHLRRATLDFLAMRLRVENSTNKSTGLKYMTPLAVNDYGTGVVKTSLPVDPDDREAMGAEILSILTS